MLKRLLAKPLLSDEVETLIQLELDSILGVCQPCCVYLFGSAARHQMTDASDLDLLVVLPDPSDLKVIKRSYYCRQKPHLWPVDLIFMQRSDFQIKSQIGGIAMICRQEGRIIFGGNGD